MSKAFRRGVMERFLHTTSVIPRLLLHLTIIMLLPTVQRVVSEVTCTAGSFQLDSVASMTCHYNRNMTQQNFNVLHAFYGNGSKAGKLVVLCNWDLIPQLQCQSSAGYHFDKVITSNGSLTVEIRTMSTDKAGVYACQLVPDNGIHYGPCNLTVEERPITTTTQMSSPTTTLHISTMIPAATESDASSAKTALGVFLAIAIIVSVLLCCGIVYMAKSYRCVRRAYYCTELSDLPCAITLGHAVSRCLKLRVTEATCKDAGIQTELKELEENPTSNVREDMPTEMTGACCVKVPDNASAMQDSETQVDVLSGVRIREARPVSESCEVPAITEPESTDPESQPSTSSPLLPKVEIHHPNTGFCRFDDNESLPNSPVSMEQEPFGVDEGDIKNEDNDDTVDGKVFEAEDATNVGKKKKRKSVKSVRSSKSSNCVVQ